MRCELVSWHRVSRLAELLAVQVVESGFWPETIIAIGRGGYVPARLLCDLLDIFDLRSLRVEHYTGTTKHASARVVDPLCGEVEGRRTLVVDDVSDSGDTYRVALEHIESFRPAAIRTAALHHKTVSAYRPDHYAQEVRRWRWLIYPWALKEDLSALIGTMDSPPTDIGGIVKRLQQDFGVRLPERRIAGLLFPGKS
ncbi:MAG: phosphoribosyltransferase [Pseudomonadota bacterium]|nr:phosphoribosyltransferase [Pseudomonadota bacterium]